MADSNSIQDHESPLRKIMANTDGTNYQALPPLHEAKQAENAYLIMEGDDCGQIYLVAPVEMVKADQRTLEALLKDLDDRAWKDISMARLFYEVHEPGTAIGGGMGGGRAERDLWVHKHFEDIKDGILNVITGSGRSIHP